MIGQHPNAQQPQPSKYVKIWEGTLSGQRQGQPRFICKLEGYRSGTASETLAADWPETMQIVRLIAQEHMNNKQYVGKADFLVFRTLNQQGFLGLLQEKKLCAVILLPSQTLLLSVSDKACRLIGMLFPGDMVVFKPEVSTQQPPMQQQQLQQHMHMQLQGLPLHQQQLPQMQQLVSHVNGRMMGRQPVGVGGITTANVKVEPATIPAMASAPTFSHITPISNMASQGVSTLQSSSPSLISQEANIVSDSVHEQKPKIGVNPVQQPVRPGGHGSFLNNLSQASRLINSTSLGGAAAPMGLPNMGATPIQVHMSNMISSGMTSALSVMSSISGSGQPIGTQQMVQSTSLGSFGSNTSTVSSNSNIAVSSSLANIQSSMSMGQSVPPMAQGGLMSGSQSGQGGIAANQNMMSGLGATTMSSAPAMMATPGMAQQAGVNSLGVTNSAAMNMPIGQHPNAQQPQPSKYVKIWEGTLSGQRQGQPRFICKLEGYRSGTASETLAADWPETMQIVRLIAQEHMNNKQYVGKADFLVFRTLNQHGFLGQLQEKKLCAVIRLPSQTLLLSVSDKACRLIGMLFPGDMVVFKPEVSTQQPPMQQQQLQQHMHMQPQGLPLQQQQLPQMQQQQPLPQQMQQQQPLQQQMQQPRQPLQQQMEQLQQIQQQQQQQEEEVLQLQHLQQQIQQLQHQQQHQQLYLFLTLCKKFSS